MAGLRSDAGATHDRGQLLLVGALAIGLLLLGLGAVLNTAVVTQQLATAPDTRASASPAIQYRSAARRGVGGALVAVNHPNVTRRSTLARLGPGLPRDLTDVSHATLRKRLDRATGEWSGLSGRLDAIEATTSGAGLRSVTNGTRLAQYERREFTNQSGKANWTLASDVDGVRAFRLNVSTAALLDDCDDGQCFQVVVANGSESRRVSVEQTADGAQLIVTGPDGTDNCTASGDWVLVELSGGTVGGEVCPALARIGTLEPPLTVRFRNATAVEGRYELLVSGDVTADGDYAGDGGPDIAPAVYAADVRVSVRTDSLTYQSTIRVAPGENDA